MLKMVLWTGLETDIISPYTFKFASNAHFRHRHLASLSMAHPFLSYEGVTYSKYIKEV